jgi:hypothetical protein
MVVKRRPSCGQLLFYELSGVNHAIWRMLRQEVTPKSQAVLKPLRTLREPRDWPPQHAGAAENPKRNVFDRIATQVWYHDPRPSATDQGLTGLTSIGVGRDYPPTES